jgi:hypothetical protein
MNQENTGIDYQAMNNDENVGDQQRNPPNNAPMGQGNPGDQHQNSGLFDNLLDQIPNPRSQSVPNILHHRRSVALNIQ